MLTLFIVLLCFFLLILPAVLEKKIRGLIIALMQSVFYIMSVILYTLKIKLLYVILVLMIGFIVPQLIVKLLLSWAIKHNRKIDNSAIVPLNHANALSSILKTHKDAYKFSQDKESLMAFMIYTYLGGADVKITDDMARLFEKQLRMKDLYLDTGLNADKTAMLPEDEHANLIKQLAEEAKIFVWIPVVDVLESLNEGATCLDIKVPSITLARTRFDDGVDFHNVIACPVNEYYTGSEFTKDQVLIVEQDRYINIVIEYSQNDKEIIINGKLLFAVNQFESLPRKE